MYFLGWSPLHWAVFKNQTEMVNLILEHGADVDLQDPDGKYPLHFAMHKHPGNSRSLLLQHGANVNIQNNYGISLF